MKELVLAFAGSFFPSVLFNIERKNLFWAGLSGAVGWGIYALSYRITSNTVFSVLLGSIGIGIYGEAMARIRKSPASIFTIAGIFPLVPGIGAYNTIFAIVKGRVAEAYNTGIETLAVAGAIAFGVMLATAFFKIIRKQKKYMTAEGEK